MITTLDEAIKHCEEKATELRERSDVLSETSTTSKGKEISDCLECAEEHEQLAEWLTELKERREADRWILVSEKLPDKEGRCIVSTDYGDVAMDSFVDGMFVLNLGNVVAWKPLPELYKKSEDK